MQVIADTLSQLKFQLLIKSLQNKLMLISMTENSMKLSLYNLVTPFVT